MPDKTRATEARDASGRWLPGVSGCPGGRPSGSRHRVSRAVEELLDGDAERLTRKAIEMAMGGDTTALRLCLERIAPPRRDRPVTVDLPPLAGTADLPALTAAILSAVAAGELEPAQAAELAKLVTAHQRAIEVAELERRLTTLEQMLQRGARE